MIWSRYPDQNPRISPTTMDGEFIYVVIFLRIKAFAFIIRSHSDDVDSWFLEAHTPSLHQDYENFYDAALKKKVICPKFYSCV